MQNVYEVGRKRYLVIILTLIYACNQADRYVFGILLQDIKKEFILSDTQVGLLAGLSFAALYALVSVPLARLADRGNRVAIISVCVVFWSAASGMCAAAGTFIQLMLGRMGVSVGEGGSHAPSISLISDNYSRDERPRALARYLLGGPIAIIVTYFSAGWLNEIYGWRFTLIAFGTPGIILGPIAWFTLKDFGKRKNGLTSNRPEFRPSTRDVLSTLYANRTFRNLFYFWVSNGIFYNAVTQWQPVFFLRSFNLSTGNLGTILSVVQGVGYFSGIYIGGELATRLGRNNERIQLVCVSIAYTTMSLLLFVMYVSQNLVGSLAVFALYSIILGTTASPTYAAVQAVVQPNSRAFALSLLQLFYYLIGLGLGPLIVGIVSDALSARLGSDSLRAASILMLPGIIWSSWYLWVASRSIDDDLVGDVSETTG